MSTDGSEQETPSPTATPAAPAASPKAGVTRRQALWVAIALAVFAVVFAVRWKRRGRSTTAGGTVNTFVERASAEELAFLAPITTGSRIGTARVLRISPIREGAIHLLVSQSSREFQLAVALGDERRPGPRFGRYGVYVWEPHPTPAMTTAAEALAQSLSASVDRSPPAGMTIIRHNP